jgi:hypothetical protein
MVCDGCNSCCSRLCAPGPSGRNICQPASGCHVTGDLCRKDADCCGGDPTSDLPGAGNVVCDIDPGKTIGLCRNPNSCNPEGNVCHFKGYECSVSDARANCCDGLGSKSGACQLDELGVPRCYAISDCRAAGETCASVADCCNDVPCVADSAGVLRCAVIPSDQPKCIPSGGSCSINGDCCPGTSCIRAPGSTDGICSEPTGPGGTGGSSSTGGAGGSSGTGGTAGGGTWGSSGGATGGSSTGGSSATGGSSGSGTGGGTSCASYGQICGSGADCCNSVPCNGGICRYFTP